MKDKDCIKAFRVLTQRIRQINHNNQATLCLYITHDLTARLMFRGFDLYSICNQYFRNLDLSANYGNCTYSNLFKMRHVGTVFSFANMKGVSKNAFMRTWLENAIGNKLYVSDDYRSLQLFFDKHETIESLCVEYDMKL